MTFRGADIKVEVANFCAAVDTLIDQDDLKVEVANFCAVMDTLVDQDEEVVFLVALVCLSVCYQQHFKIHTVHYT